MTESCSCSSRDLERSVALPLREPRFGKASGGLEDELDNDVNDEDNDEEELDEVLVSEP